MEKEALKKIVIASFFGFIIGFIAGLLGVGGGEFRLPVLVCLLGFPVPIAAAANLIIGILTVTVGLGKRWSMGYLLPDIFYLLVVMCIASILGAYIGAWSTGKVKEKYLKYSLAVLLVCLGIKLITEPFIGIPLAMAPGFPLDLVLGFVFAFLIAVVCGALGVAGGELRIPALMYIFSLPIKIAGTASLLVSLPAVCSGAIKHAKIGHVNKDVILVTVAMGIPSMVGAYIGASFATMVSDDFLKILLGIILLLATIRVIKP